MSELNLTIKLEGEAFADWDHIDEAVTNRIADLLLSDHSLKLRQRVKDLVDATVTAHVEQKLSDLLSKPIQPMTRFGEPIPGQQPKTLEDILAEAIDDAMTETVDRSGKPTTDKFNNPVPRLSWLLNRVAKQGIAEAVTKAVKDVNAEARAAVQKQVADEIAARLAK